MLPDLDLLVEMHRGVYYTVRCGIASTRNEMVRGSISAEARFVTLSTPLRTLRVKSRAMNAF